MFKKFKIEYGSLINSELLRHTRDQLKMLSLYADLPQAPAKDTAKYYK